MTAVFMRFSIILQVLMLNQTTTTAASLVSHRHGIQEWICGFAEPAEAKMPDTEMKEDERKDEREDGMVSASNTNL